MRTIAIYGTEVRRGAEEALRRLFALVGEHYDRVYIRRGFGEYLHRLGVGCGEKEELGEDFPADAAVVVSIGGDGTFLRAAQWVGSREVPIIGLNAGHLGFLSSYSLSEVDALAGMLCHGAGAVERRIVLEAIFPQSGRQVRSFALNEVAVVKSVTASMLTVRAYRGGRFVADYMADGLVIATPTGSTAYNLAVGGPILSPTLEGMILSPIAPHSLTMRPLVVGADEELEFEIYSRAGECHLALDGRTHSVACPNPREMSGGEIPELPSGGGLVRVRRADFGVMVLRRPDSDFATLLREKLLWGKR